MRAKMFIAQPSGSPRNGRVAERGGDLDHGVAARDVVRRVRRLRQRGDPRADAHRRDPLAHRVDHAPPLVAGRAGASG
jgi:hypothetical protein